MRRVYLCGLLGVVLGLGGCAGDAGPGGVQVGGPVPSFTLRTAANETVTSASLRGQVVILNFWSTTCGPCVRELPELQRVAEASGATVIGIALDEGGWGAVRPVVERYHLTYRIALGDEALFERFGGVGIPYTVVLDREQRVFKVYRGSVTREILEKDLRDLGART
jgi:cytochrome c biogenesis protein CcmG/thiol:disulfide interchange protein DsbE